MITRENLGKAWDNCCSLPPCRWISCCLTAVIDLLCCRCCNKKKSPVQKQELKDVDAGDVAQGGNVQEAREETIQSGTLPSGNAHSGTLSSLRTHSNYSTPPDSQPLSPAARSESTLPSVPQILPLPAADDDESVESQVVADEDESARSQAFASALSNVGVELSLPHTVVGDLENQQSGQDQQGGSLAILFTGLSGSQTPSSRNSPVGSVGAGIGLQTKNTTPGSRASSPVDRAPSPIDRAPSRASFGRGPSSAKGRLSFSETVGTTSAGSAGSAGAGAVLILRPSGKQLKREEDAKKLQEQAGSKKEGEEDLPQLSVSSSADTRLTRSHAGGAHRSSKTTFKNTLDDPAEDSTKCSSPKQSALELARARRAYASSRIRAERTDENEDPPARRDSLSPDG